MTLLRTKRSRGIAALVATWSCMFAYFWWDEGLGDALLLFGTTAGLLVAFVGTLRWIDRGTSA